LEDQHGDRSGVWACGAAARRETSARPPRGLRVDTPLAGSHNRRV